MNKYALMFERTNILKKNKQKQKRKEKENEIYEDKRKKIMKKKIEKYKM